MSTTIEQIDAWRGKRENEHLEFKEAKNQFNFESLLAYCVAIANEGGGVLLLGIANHPPRAVVGTRAFPDPSKTTKGVLDKLHFRVNIEEVQHPDGRVLVFHIPPRPTGHPRDLDGTYYMRSGESLVPMTPDQLNRIFDEGKDKLSGLGMFGYTLLTCLVLVSMAIGFRKLSEAEIQPKINRDMPSAPQPAEQRSDDARAATSTKPSPQPKSRRVDWHEKQNWRKYLRVGMSEATVRELFGEAEQIKVYETIETWRYGSGEVEFYNGTLHSWSEPD